MKPRASYNQRGWTGLDKNLQERGCNQEKAVRTYSTSGLVGSRASRALAEFTEAVSICCNNSLETTGVSLQVTLTMIHYCN